MYPIPPTEKLVETRQCRHCQADFPITDKDLEFFNKVSPTFAGQKCQIPAPTLCPDCRQQRRLSWRNERKLYKRKCDATGKDIVCVYSPDKANIVFQQEEWWSDHWDPMSYGRDFDFSRPFFEQWKDFSRNIPLPSMATSENQNSDYVNYADHLGNCYLVFVTSFAQNCLYSYGIDNTKNSIDMFASIGCDECYNGVHLKDCYKTHHSLYSVACRDSGYLYDCQNCESCIFCSNLVGKQYCFLNEEIGRDRYLTLIASLGENLERYLGLWKEKIANLPKRSAYGNSNDQISGDFINHSHRTHFSYCTYHAENVRYSYDTLRLRDSQDVTGVTDISRGYCGHAVIESDEVLFSSLAIACHKVFYSYGILASDNVFGCIGLRNKSYCILNKQYTREEYEELVPKIIEHMKATGEWGEFFPSSLSPFGYNETVASEYFPMSRELALEHGFNWSDYEAPFPKVEKVIPAAKLPTDIAAVPDDILNWAVECEVTGKPFRIIKQELEFYRKHGLSVPRRHPDQRHLDRMALRNPRKLYERECEKCGKEMTTTYAPERPEIVYCEECYNQEVV